MKLALRFFAACLLSAALLTFCACVGATRMPTRQHGSSGQQIDSKTFDPSFVQPGITTRDEVLAKLSTVNTGYDDPHFFWGRWATSKWGYWWVVVAPSTSGGGGAGAGDAKRIWHVHNILLTFDEHGIAQSTQLLDDGDPSLWRELNKHAATLAPMDSTQIVSLFGDSNITLTSAWIEAVRPKGKIQSIHVSPDKVVRISHSGAHDKRNSPGTTCHVLYLSEKTAFGKKLDFCSEGKNLIAALHYLHQYAPANMKWE